MNLDDELAELLARLGVSLEVPEQALYREGGNADERENLVLPGEDVACAPYASAAPAHDLHDLEGDAELSLFQTSREHYGVFYRLDLVGGQPQLRVFVPDERGAARMRCYVVRAVNGSPVSAWFTATRAHEGSLAFEDARDTTEQHLLFAAGEAMKRLFWAGEPDALCFPDEITVTRVL